MLPAEREKQNLAAEMARIFSSSHSYKNFPAHKISQETFSGGSKFALSSTNLQEETEVLTVISFSLRDVD